MIFFEAIFLISVLIVAVPLTILTAQILISLLPDRQRADCKYNKQIKIAVLMPAHNEDKGIAASINSVNKQLKANDQLIVIADNCDDDTAKIARENGALAIERHDLTKRGKGYALDYGVRYLERQNPPDIVVIVDSDCILAHGALMQISSYAMQYQRPVQALYLMRSPDGAGLKVKVAEFAWVVKNWVRALGYQRLGLPCQLMGTGMAFPWDLISKADLASGHIVEDLKLGLDFASVQRAPVFCPEAIVQSTFPLNVEGVDSQRTRWEHGHLAMIVKEGPELILKGLANRNLHLTLLALDMCVPPLALFALILSCLMLASLLMMILERKHARSSGRHAACDAESRRRVPFRRRHEEGR